MEREQVTQALNAIGSAYSRLTYSQFCALINDGREDYWTEEKWDEWRKLNHAIDRLSSKLISRLI